MLNTIADFISFKTINNFFLSFLNYQALSQILFTLQVVALYFIAKFLTLDLFDLKFEESITQVSLGARFLTRLFQLYLLRACMRRMLDILGLEKLNLSHIAIILCLVFLPIYLGQFPLFLIVLAVFPKKGFRTSNSLQYQ